MVYIRDGSKLKTVRERNSIMTIATAAYCGFRELGEEVVWFTDINGISPGREDIVVGSIRDMEDIFSRFDITLPIIEYPGELSDFFGRKIWTEPSLHRLIAEQKTGIFIKPADGMKRFTGKVIRSPIDYCNLIFDSDLAVSCSHVLDIVSEWRCYVCNGKVFGVKNYRGDPFTPPSKAFIEAAINAYRSAPAGYSLDVGVLKDGTNIVIEVNDGYSLGVYGLLPLPYAKLLSARYCELMGVIDYHS